MSGEKWTPWQEMDGLVSWIEKDPLAFPDEVVLASAEPYIQQQFRQIRAMIDAIKTRNVEALRGLISGDSLVFAYTSNIRILLQGLEEFG